MPARTILGQPGGPVTSSTQTFVGDVFFKSGRPWADVRAYGAAGDGVTDDTAAIQSAINAIAALGGGIVYFPPGHYMVLTGPLTVTSNSTLLVGAGQDTSLLDAGTVNSVIVQVGRLTGAQIFRSGLSYLQLIGPNATSATNAVVRYTALAIECTGSDLLISGGYYAIEVDANADCVLTRIKAASAYGPALIYTTAPSLFMDRCKLDQSYPVSTPGANSIAAINAWASTTAYTSGTIVSDGNYYLQCSTAGTSGSSLPTVPAYGATVTDGSAVWKLVARSTYYAIQADTGAGNLYITRTDMTGPYSRAVGITNTLAGTAPQNIVIETSTMGANLFGCVYAIAGAGLSVHDCVAQNVVVQGSAAIGTSGAWVGDAVVSDNLIYVAGYGISNGAGTNFTAIGNRVFGMATAGLFAGAGITRFVFADNIAGSSATWGTNAIGIQVATGASNNYNVVNNVVAGATTGISDGGTGANKTVTGNN